MRHEPGLKEDAKNLSIVAGSALLGALLTATILGAQLRPAHMRTSPTRAESSTPERQQSDARFILIGHHSSGKQDLHVVVVRAGNGSRVVSVHSGRAASVVDARDASESPPTP